MSSAGDGLDRYYFGAFELCPEQGELLRDGQRVAIQPQPLKVLTVLVVHAGRLVRRADLVAKVWDDETHVDFDRSLNYCVRQIRAALDDDAADPRFIRTQPRLGYRFIADVHRRPISDDGKEPARHRHPLRRAAAIASAALVLSLGMAWWLVPASAGRAEPDSRALQEYLRGQHLAQHGETPDEALRSLEHFERAVSLDPGFARGHLGVAQATLRVPGDAARGVERSHAAVERALALDPNLAAAHAHVANLKRYADWDWDGADVAYRRAIRLEPGQAPLRHDYAGFLAMLGRHDAAIEQIERAMELDPVSTAIKADAGWFYYQARRLDDAERLCEVTLELDPGNRNALWCLLQARRLADDSDGALAAAQRLAGLSGQVPAPNIPDLDAFWRWHLDWLDEHPQVGSPSTIGLDHLALGDRDRALELFELAYARRSSCVLSLAADPQLDPLRGDPRFDDLLARLGLPG